MATNKLTDQYSDKIATKRMENAIRLALSTPPKPHSEMTAKGKRAKPKSKSRVKKGK